MSKVVHNQRGYCGSSRSLRAVEAERAGKLPLTRAAQWLREQCGVSLKCARQALAEIGPCEWHHTSKYANPTDYYDTAAAERYIEAEPVLARLPKDWREAITTELKHGDFASRHSRGQKLVETLAIEAGGKPWMIWNAYFHDWSEEEDE